MAILYANGGETVEGITRLQKLVFLAQKEVLDEEPYNFEADDYGPFSTDLYRHLDELEQNRYIEREDEVTDSGNEKVNYQLTERGLDYAESLFEGHTMGREIPLQQLEDLKNNYNDVPLLKLLKYVYDEYPDMAENSKLSLV